MKKVVLLLTILMIGFVVAQPNIQNQPNNSQENFQNQTALNKAAEEVVSGEKDSSNVSQQVRDRVAEMLRERQQINEQLKNQSRVRVNTSQGAVEFQKQGRRMSMMARGIRAETEMNITQNQTGNQSQLRAQLSNGRNARIMVMPDTASQQALEQLRLRVCSEENNCSIELKETGEGNQTRASYQVRAEKQARILGLFKTKMPVEAEVDAETGETRTRKPWWAFLASESESED